MPMKLPAGSTLEPREDTVLCRMYEDISPASEIAPSIIVPDVAREEVFFAHVETTGPGRIMDVLADGTLFRKPISFHAGDDVIFSRYHGERVLIGQALYLVLKQDDLLCAVRMPKEKEGAYYRFAGAGGSVDKRLEAAVAGSPGSQAY